jgi:hypothetical protein
MCIEMLLLIFIIDDLILVNICLHAVNISISFQGAVVSIVVLICLNKR